MRFIDRTVLASVSVLGLIGFSTLASGPAHAKEEMKSEKAAEAQEMREADKDMRKVLAELKKLGAKPIGTQSVEDTRKGPTPADAVKAVLKAEGKDPMALMAAMKVAKKDTTYPTAGGSQPARIYTPEAAGSGPLPVILYFHGGGFVIADIDTYEASAMAMAHKTGAIVVSAEYRHAPEAKFPAQHEDAVAAYKWVVQNAEQFNGDGKRVALMGESAGGNLAVNVAIAARDQKLEEPAYMVLVYPVAGTDTDTPSYRKNAQATPLSKPAMEWFVQNTIAKPEDKKDVRLDLVHADLKGLPDATVITDEIDPLMSEGQELAQLLRKGGSEVKYQNYEGVTHEFFGMAPVVKDAERAQDLAARELKDAFEEAAKSAGSTSDAKKAPR